VFDARFGSARLVLLETEAMTAIPEAAETTGLSTTQRRVGERIRDARETLSSVDRDVQRFVRRKPLTAALTALAVGFVVGRVVSRL
jgi:ElaB/YqjD/DUF883 family membrane-anchored ribosome-binding protein